MNILRWSVVLPNFCFDSTGLVGRDERGGAQTVLSEAAYACCCPATAGFTAPKCCDGGVGYDVWGQRRDCRGVAGGLQGLAADCREVHGGCTEVQEVHTVDWPAPSGPPRFCSSASACSKINLLSCISKV